MALILFSLVSGQESRSADVQSGQPTGSGVVHSGGGLLHNGSIILLGQSIVGQAAGTLSSGGTAFGLELHSGYLPQWVALLPGNEHQNPEPPRILGVVLGDDQLIELSLSGPLGIAFRLQQSSDLVQWRDLSSISFDAPLIRLTVPGPVTEGPKAAFFRLVWIPGR